jgi:hypothetical protein
VGDVQIGDMQTPEMLARVVVVLDVTADKLERAWAAETRVLALDRDDREGLLRVMEDWCPPELGELRASILQQAAWRRAEGL